MSGGGIKVSLGTDLLDVNQILKITGVHAIEADENDVLDRSRPQLKSGQRVSSAKDAHTCREDNEAFHLGLDGSQKSSKCQCNNRDHPANRTKVRSASEEAFQPIDRARP